LKKGDEELWLNDKNKPEAKWRKNMKEELKEKKNKLWVKQAFYCIITKIL